MVRYAGQVITRFRIRNSGRTAFRRLKGFDPVKPVTEFAECVCVVQATEDVEQGFKVH